MKELNPRVANAGGSPTVRAGISSFLFPGCGFGGSCFPKDVKALAAHAKRSGATTPMLESVLAINAEQPHKLTAILRKHLDDLRGVRVAVLGLAFKPGTDDVRESPAIPVVNDLLAAGAIVRAYDPIATEQARKVLGDRIEYAKSLPEVLDGARAVVLVTRWEEFRRVPELINEMQDPPLLVDGRRFLSKDGVRRYAGIGL
jgi:UDPglucose 6-dehydrogenase